MKLTALIMAGGRGERFWPKSRKAFPKQFLALTKDRMSMIQQTVARLLPLMDISDIFISTNIDYKQLVTEQLPLLPEENILCEPVGKNTAPCIGLGAIHIRKKYGDAVMIVLPSDHSIKQPSLFRSVLKNAAKIAEKEKALVTLGIPPTEPDTGYGYIQLNAENTTAYDGAFFVEKFVEKPDLELAKQYYESGSYLWNSGMFIWRASTILEEMAQHLPDNYALLEKIAEAIGLQRQEEVLQAEFPKMQSISIDYGIMERTQGIYIIPASFGWDDVGSWLAISRINPTSDDQSNVIDGDVVSVNTARCIVQGGDRLIAMIGLEDVIIVDMPDSLLLCAKDSASDIKKIVEALRNRNRNELL